MGSKIRLDFVGVGGMGQCAHLRNYASIPDCEVVAIAEPRAQMRALVGQRYNIPATYADHRQMLANEKLDGIVAVQQFVFHGALIPELFTAGVPVLTEKPIGKSLAIADRIISALHDSRASLRIGYHKRSDPAIVHAKTIIDAWKMSGEMGTLRHIRVTMPPGDWIAGGFFDLISSSDPYPTMSEDADPAGMNSDTVKGHWQFVNYYIHQVNLLHHLFGESYAVTYADPSGALMVVESASGVPGTLEMATYNSSNDWQETIDIAFERGFVRIELPAPLVINRAGRVTVFTDPGKPGTIPQFVSPVLPPVHAMREQALNFLRHIRGESTPLATAEDARADLVVAHHYTDLLCASRDTKNAKNKEAHVCR